MRSAVGIPPSGREDVNKRFGSRPRAAVEGPTFEVPPGQIVGFLGPNCAYKSTTLKMLTGILEPSEGTATICGFDLRTAVIEVQRHVGFVPASGAVFESLTGPKYLEIVAALYARRASGSNSSSPSSIPATT